MKIYAIGDLHLSFEKKVEPTNWQDIKEYKSMSIFGDSWEKHYKRIYYNWQEVVSSDDIVLVPGDISWATTFDETNYDFEFISKLPGKKIFIRGNHDYWWQSINKMRLLVPEDFQLIQNDSVSIKNVSIAGSRGWLAPNQNKYTEKDEKLYKRELIRLELSLKNITENNRKIIMMHYMPVNEKHEKNEYIELLQQYNVDQCIYGHLHGAEAHEISINGSKWGIDFKLVSADFLDFKPELIYNFD